MAGRPRFLPQVDNGVPAPLHCSSASKYRYRCIALSLNGSRRINAVWNVVNAVFYIIMAGGKVATARLFRAETYRRYFG